MPLNNRRVIQILLDEVDGIEEQCDGYRNVIRDAVVEIIDYELDNMINGTNIQQKVTGTCSSTGEWVAKQFHEGANGS